LKQQERLALFTEEPTDEGHFASVAEKLRAAPRAAQAFQGKYYTPDQISGHVLESVCERLLERIAGGQRKISVCDPFAGDGRLVRQLITRVAAVDSDLEWDVECWDSDGDALKVANQELVALRRRLNLAMHVRVREMDSFHWFANHPDLTFDVVVTNPPWEHIKPDSRHLSTLSDEDRYTYIDRLKTLDRFLADNYPAGVPTKRYGGWGLNLSRVGAELAMRLTRADGLGGIVLPASVLADDVSTGLRAWFFDNVEIFDIAMFPAEMRLFAADVASTTLAYSRRKPLGLRARFTTYDAREKETALDVELSNTELGGLSFAIPAGAGATGFWSVQHLGDNPRFGDLERLSGGLWAGRELDETRVAEHLREDQPASFIKGRMIGRFTVIDVPTHGVYKPGWNPPTSVSNERIVWRDVSRTNQKRRVQATVIPAGWVAGNSLGVAYFKDGNHDRLLWLLGVMSSLAFEIQLRALLMTGHVTLSSLRKVHIPMQGAMPKLDDSLVERVKRTLNGDHAAEAECEAITASMYGFTPDELQLITASFPKLTAQERETIAQTAKRLR